MSYSAIIIDDELNGLNALKLLLENHCPQIRIIAGTQHPEEGIHLIEKLKPQVLFLDINMPLMDAFQLYGHLNYKHFKLIFTTAHPELAFKAVRLKPHDYLLKPIDAEELKVCINNLYGLEKAKSDAGIEEHILDFSVKNGVIFLRPREIVRFEAAGSYTTIYLFNGQRHTVSKNLKDCEAMVNPHYFFRCHLSHLVNMRHVKELLQTRD